MVDSAHLPTIVIGAGSAGLSTSFHLKRLGVRHAVLERSRVGDTWRRARWDSFTLVTPNWSVLLPGMPYNGPDPDGFMTREEVVAYLERYAAANDLPVRSGVDVSSVRPDGGRWRVATDTGPLTADNVVVAAGAFPEPHRGPPASGIARRVRQVHTSAYRNPQSLPEGGVLVVGTGQSGIQIAEELLEDGREVTISVGRCPRAPRRYRGRDAYAWMVESRFMFQPLGGLPSPSARLACNPQLSGRDGGHDVDVWTLARRGATLVGRVAAAVGETVTLAPDLEATLAASEKASRELLDMVDAYIARAGLAAPPPEPSARDFSRPAAQEPLNLHLRERGISTIVWATGYRPSFPWVEGCDFDGNGFPVTQRGVTRAPGLYFVGLHFLSNRSSGILLGVGEDAKHVAEHIASGARP